MSIRRAWSLIILPNGDSIKLYATRIIIKLSCYYPYCNGLLDILKKFQISEFVITFFKNNKKIDITRRFTGFKRYQVFYESGISRP